MGFARNHLLVEDADDSDATLLQPVKNYVLPLFVAAKPWADCVARAAHP
jgi:hypothetical protein